MAAAQSRVYSFELLNFIFYFHLIPHRTRTLNDKEEINSDHSLPTPSHYYSTFQATEPLKIWPTMSVSIVRARTCDTIRKGLADYKRGKRKRFIDFLCPPPPLAKRGGLPKLLIPFFEQRECIFQNEKAFPRLPHF